ncbi:MAG TPA: NAD-dependent epimerase/dehydratase family protein [Caulobacteraceae bacterium]|jgi:nucleoside-diphosphate-sugar epimerase
MASTAFIIGGTGQIGRATARNLLAKGWRVRLAQRSDAGLPADLAGRVDLVELDRDQPGALAAGLAGGADAVIDTVAFTEAHARQLIALSRDIGALVVISSASVYRDGAGRTLDEAAQTGFPEFPVPIGEDQPTVEAGPATYSTAKVALEQALLQDFPRPVTILRPAAIYGDGSRHPREWWFVKRLLDGRRRIPLAYEGQSRFHTSATANIAELCRIALEQPATRVLNAADPRALTVAEIGAAIAAAYGVDLDFVRLSGPPKRGVGAHPWCIPEAIVLDMSRAEALGYRPVVRYEDAVGEACRSVEAAAAAGVVFPAYINALFDYTAEDAALAKA